MTPNYGGQRSELSWLLDDLVNRVAQVKKAVMLTQDGLAIGASAGLSREDAEHLAALAAGFQSMARGAGEHFGGGQVRQTVIEMEAAYLFVSAAGHGTCLAVLSSADADVGLVAYEMAVLVRRSNEHLGVGLRPGAGPPSGPPSGPASGPVSASRPQPMPGGRPAAAPYQPASPYVPGGVAAPAATPAPNPIHSPYSMPAGRPAPFTQ